MNSDRSPDLDAALQRIAQGVDVNPDRSWALLRRRIRRVRQRRAALATTLAVIALGALWVPRTRDTTTRLDVTAPPDQSPTVASTNDRPAPNPPTDPRRSPAGGHNDLRSQYNAEWVLDQLGRAGVSGHLVPTPTFVPPGQAAPPPDPTEVTVSIDGPADLGTATLDVRPTPEHATPPMETNIQGGRLRTINGIDVFIFDAAPLEPNRTSSYVHQAVFRCGQLDWTLQNGSPTGTHIEQLAEHLATKLPC